MGLSWLRVSVVGLLVLAVLVGGTYGVMWYSARDNDRMALVPRIEASNLMLVETVSFGSSDASITTYERTGRYAVWRQVGEATRAKIGKAGLGWGHTFRRFAKPGEPIKQEGDKRAPAGIFPLGRAFGFGKDVTGSYMQLGEGQHFCVDDVNSERYSQIVDPKSVPEGTSGEKMWEIGLYKRGIIVDYPTDRKAKSGSCIFVHIWKSPETPTVGCVAASEETVERLQKWVSGATKGAVIAIVPKGARDRLGLALPE